ncbi:hypothetical protein Tco_1406283 [Tanacetum coccineum]
MGVRRGTSDHCSKRVCAHKAQMVEHEEMGDREVGERRELGEDEMVVWEDCVSGEVREGGVWGRKEENVERGGEGVEVRGRM